MDNPFAVPERPSAVLKTVKILVCVSAALGAIVALQAGSQRWLLARLMQDFEQQPAEVQRQRLAQVAQLGSRGLPILVAQLQAPEEAVAETAFELLQQQQQQWIQLPDSVADAQHRQLTTELAKLSDALPLRRGGWVARLLNQTIVETVEHPSEDAAAAYRSATELLTKLTVSDSPSGLLAAGSSSMRVAFRSEPLPLQTPPPAAESQTQQATNQTSPGDEAAAQSTGEDSRPLQAVPEQGAVQLRPRKSPKFPSIPRSSIPVPVQHLSDEPFDSYTTRSVIAWLRSVQPQLRDAADQELRRRGMDESELALAARLADPDVRIRVGLLNELSRGTEHDPRRWLLWLAEDAEPEVRRRAISVLGTMQDSEIRKQLNQQLAQDATQRSPI